MNIMHASPIIETIQIPLTEEHRLILEACDKVDVHGLPALFQSYRECGREVREQFSEKLSDALVNRDNEMAACLVAEGVPITRFIVQQAARAGSKEAVQMILQLGWDIDWPCGTMQSSALS